MLVILKPHEAVSIFAVIVQWFQYTKEDFIVQRDVVLADVRQQIKSGAEHITFGDSDFFNGPTHAVRLVKSFHEEFPNITYNVTIKVEHLLTHPDKLAI